MHFFCSSYALPHNFLFSFESWDQEFQEDGGEAGAGIGGAVVEASDDYTNVMVESEEEENDEDMHPALIH